MKNLENYSLETYFKEIKEIKLFLQFNVHLIVSHVRDFL